MSAVNMVAEDGLSVDPAHWTQRQAGIIQAAAEEPEVERIFVNPAIKKTLCETAHGAPWMAKVRAYWGHNYHFHVRIACPAGETGCEPQEPVPPGDGCGKSLAWWFTDEALHPKVDGKPKAPLTWRNCRRNAGRSCSRSRGSVLGGAVGRGPSGRIGRATGSRRRKSGGCRSGNRDRDRIHGRPP